MKALILAAGYAQRLYPLTLNRSKALLPVGDRLMVEHVISRLEGIAELDRIFVVTNQKFVRDYQCWQAFFSSPKEVEIVNDKTDAIDNKLGAVGDIEFVLRNKNIADDLLVIAGDNLFDFNLDGFLSFCREKRPYGVTGAYNVGSRRRARKYGVVKLDGDNRVVKFEEKPPQPRTSMVSIALYFLPAETLPLVSRYLAEGNQPDAPGNYVRWLTENDRVYGFVFNGDWYDIGDIDSYLAANKKYGMEVSLWPGKTSYSLQSR